MVTIPEDGRLEIEDGEFVRFTEVRGLTALNTCPPKKIKVLGTFTLL